MSIAITSVPIGKLMTTTLANYKHLLTSIDWLKYYSLWDISC